MEGVSFFLRDYQGSYWYGILSTNLKLRPKVTALKKSKIKACAIFKELSHAKA